MSQDKKIKKPTAEEIKSIKDKDKVKKAAVINNETVKK